MSETSQGLDHRVGGRALGGRALGSGLFPHAEQFLVGLKRRMNALATIHLHQIQRLLDLYGAAAVSAAIDRASAFKNYSALALTRILQRHHPNGLPEAPTLPIAAGPEILGVLDDIESGSPSEYTLDAMPAAPLAAQGLPYESTPQAMAATPPSPEGAPNESTLDAMPATPQSAQGSPASHRPRKTEPRDPLQSLRQLLVELNLTTAAQRLPELL